ncbi:MAG: site-specific integrase [Desulfobacterales bacterium]|nr:site-specific integrase [Desulfobacterales bacterium]
MAQSYLVQNKSGYYFRIIVPPAVRKIVGVRELKRSLRTGVLGLAKERAWIIAGKLKRLFRWLQEKIVGSEDMKLDRDKVNKIVEGYIQEGLREIEEEILVNGTVVGKTPDTYERTIGGLETLRSMDIDNAKELNLQVAYREVDEILAQQGIKVDRHHNDYKRLCHNVLKARIGLREVEIAHKQGHFNKKFDHERCGLPRPQKNTTAHANLTVVEEKPRKKKKESILLADLIQKHQQENIRSDAWSTSTQNDYKSIGKVLVRLLGDVPVHTLSFDEFREYKEAMQCLPPRFISTLKYSKMRAGDVIKLNMPQEKTISVQSINKNFAYTKSLFTWAATNRYITDNPTGVLTIKERKTSKEVREAFSANDIRAMFRNLKNGTTHSYQFWIPVLGLFTGCRREELCQLHVNDLKLTGEGIWYLDINEDTPDKTLKNTASKRVIPLHPHIVDDLKFPEYVQEIKHERIFPKLKKTNNRYGHYFGKWFNEFIKTIGVKTETKNFHSFRHGFITNLTEMMVPEVLIKSLAGHAHSDVTHGVYFKGFSIEQLHRDGVSKLDFGVDLSG